VSAPLVPLGTKRHTFVPAGPRPQRPGVGTVPCGFFVRGSHGFDNRSETAVRILLVSEQNAPNVSIYPDENRVGIFDAPHPSERRFGALFDVADAVEDYGGGRAAIVSPGEGSRGSSSGG
jgi:hypothetical protein